ncbi:hypothetical protein RGQ29_012425 [Quercus rubra]|uniref:CLAVATA3/ESR (CLE)-related protein 25 n=3 Tax=Fagaceae TaxID=3503 RepID=A0A7N2KZ77_QUELO|nr:CLAVATA3/ESR (CLE)-related protein 25 [Quercus lobata]XP_030954121.1 CLAVATA3/ESR (CLE)-related protein 25 [Quercus lobata]XP_030954122.1 CLAVATA3/ESR (CLE)-related protein 25 [Quercus lobata]XP_030954123.1 CLAVATA3/ESR (CLE)-related protein 25 [Quercus lobata]XP_050271435.1 CLAVATA3/ESR (CLE)-related protein 25 [Quercus robur]KAK4603909.1 hypothetical protein RGQ29_012425 [Quercus rubra]
MASNGRVFRATFGALVFVGVIWFITVGILANRASKRSTITVQSSQIFKYWKLIAREKHAVQWDFNLNYVSKRRVPNGPDPIHNRRAVKTGQPPGRA